MKTAFYGRMLFGAAAVVFGVIALRWHDAETWQNSRHIWSLPFGAAVGSFLMIAQIAGGIGIQISRALRPASLVLCAVYFCFALACVPDVIAASNVYDRFGGSFFVYLSLVCGAVALYAASSAQESSRALFATSIRIVLGVCTISFTLGQALLLRPTAGLVPKWIPAQPDVLGGTDNICVRTCSTCHPHQSPG